MLTFLYTGACIMLIGVSFMPPLPVVVVMLFLGMMCLGAGNGSVFQLVPQRFGNEIGLMTGIVGAAGGLGGFALPLILGQLYSSYQSYTPGFVILSLIAAASMFLVLFMQSRWRVSWLHKSSKGITDSPPLTS
jgi:NNP family nitrate/nitrite transporter-like MFS transporter